MVKVAFHVPEAARSIACLNNVRNYLNLVDNADLRVVFNGDAVKTLLTEDDTAHRWQALLEQAGNVRVLVCKNSLAGFGLASERLISPITVVPAAVLTLVELQQQGWLYLRP